MVLIDREAVLKRNEHAVWKPFAKKLGFALHSWPSA
jgi:hypothetical protein